MSLQDDVVYLALLLFSILFGHLSRLAVRDASLRRSASTLCGVAVLLAVSGAHAAYCAASFLMQLALLALVPWRSAHLVSFVTQFAYLLFFRVAPQVVPRCCCRLAAGGDSRADEKASVAIFRSGPPLFPGTRRT